MQLQYDDDFLEGVAFICASGRRKEISPLQIRRFHREREKLYSILDPDERNAAFFKLHLEWFREWGQEKWLVNLLEEFPLLSANLKCVVFRKARMKSEEGAELYVNAESGRNGIIALRIERFERPDELEVFLRHELSHLHDMVDPAFGYTPQQIPVRTASQQGLIRDRYRLLWGITIDGRLTSRGNKTVASREVRWKEFSAAYSFWPEEKCRATFDLLWINKNPKHAQLMQLASDPRDLAHVEKPLPGAPCPLCGFPTFAWSDVESLSQEIKTAIQSEFANWKPEQSACTRCVETFEVRLLPC